MNTVRVLATLACAHAAAYAAIRRVQPHAWVRWAHHYILFDPVRSSSRVERLLTGIQDAPFNGFFPHSVETGRAVAPFSLLAGDLRAVRGACDFVGINVYYRNVVSFDLRNPAELFGRRFARRVSSLGKPIYVTESGVADRDDRLRPG